MKSAAMRSERSTRLDDFIRYFDLSVAVSPAQREQVYQVRYRVYCEEFGYEPESVFGNHQEVDEFDRQSIHCLVTHRSTGMPAGCVRLVLVDGSDLMPIEAHARQFMDQQFIETFSEQRHTLCEISRLAVDGAFRHRRGERKSRFGNLDTIDFDSHEKRTFPLIAMALFLAAGAVADLMNRKNCFAIMEPFLPIILRRTGIIFRRIGEDFEYHGIRAPYYADIDELIGSATVELRLCFDAVRQQFAVVIAPDQQTSKVSKRVDLRMNLPFSRFAFRPQDRFCN